MQILLIENEQAAAEALLEEVRLASIQADVEIVRSRASAVEVLERNDENWDVVICDLKIPSTDGGLDESEEYGLLVLLESRARHPAARVLILSGFATLANVGTLINHPEIDLYGSGIPVPMVIDTSKKDYRLSIQALVSIGAELAALAAIGIESGQPIQDSDARALRVFARQKGAARVEVVSIAPGLSDAAPLQVRVLTAEGQVSGLAFAKLGPTKAIQDEAVRYRRHVNGVLPAGSFPSVVDEVLTTGGRSALIYSLIAAPARSLFDVLGDDEREAVGLVTQVRAQEASAWTAGAPFTRATVADLRAARGGRLEQAEEFLPGLDWRWLEAQEFDYQEATQHGDMHGDNVMVDPRDRAFLIDFAQTGPAPAGLDPLVLELSVAFHPRGRRLSPGWPGPSDMAEWANVDRYLSSSPYPGFVGATRDWAEANAAGHLAVLATAYAHAVRQLNYRDVDPALVRGIVSSIIGEWSRASAGSRIQ